jgi:xanthine dehydrogenase accessory factor
MFDTLVLIRGAGELGSGVAYRLVKAGFSVIMTELAQPLMVRSTVSYGTSIFYETVVIEGIIARRATPDQIPAFLAEGIIPVLVDPDGDSIRTFRPPVVVDARPAQINLDTTIDDAALVIGFGDSFTAGINCHAVIETNRGHTLGRVIWQGSAELERGQLSGINGKDAEHVLRVFVDGELVELVAIGDRVKAGDVIVRVGDVPIIAPFDAVLRGLIDSMIPITRGMMIGELDPHANREHCFTISDQSLAIGGGVVEAVLSAPQIRKILNVNPTLLTASSEANL